MQKKSKLVLCGETMHIDMSKRFNQKGTSGIAFKIVQNGKHGGMALSNKLKKEIQRDFCGERDYSKIYAICIYYLINDNLDIFDNLVICNDEDPRKVKKHLDVLFKDKQEYLNKKVISIDEFREVLGNKKIRSYADNISNTYRKKALRPLRRRQKGIKLNIIKINYKKISLGLKKLKEVE